MEREIDYYSLGNQRPGIELDLAQAKAKIKELEIEIGLLKHQLELAENHIMHTPDQYDEENDPAVTYFEPGRAHWNQFAANP